MAINHIVDALWINSGFFCAGSHSCNVKGLELCLGSNGRVFRQCPDAPSQSLVARLMICHT